MLKRKAYQKLVEWKNTHRNNCLMVKGARQVGKTYLVREFGKKEYKSFVEINFIKNQELKQIFAGTLDAESVYKKMTAMINGVNLVKGDTLIFLDEIQACGSARTALKFLAEDGRFDVITSGSLLGLTYGEDADENTEEPESVPTGYETLFREYMVVGGMPEVVADYAINHDFTRVAALQEKILENYRFDISKHAKGAEKIKVRKCYDAIPKQLAKEITKFQYSTVEKGQTSKKYGGSVQWLKDSNIVNPCYNIHEPYLPLMANADEDQFKLYINDTGLLCAMYGFETKRAILENTIKGNAKGGIYENIIAETLVKNGYALYYYKPDDSNELEFLIEKNREVVPVEVKAGNTATKSLNRFIEAYKPSAAYKIVDGNVGVSDVKLTIPHYMAMFL